MKTEIKQMVEMNCRLDQFCLHRNLSAQVYLGRQRQEV